MTTPAIIRMLEERAAAANGSPLEEVRSLLHGTAQRIVVPWIEARASERRSADGTTVELIIEGYASVFDTPTIIDYGSVAFEEVIGRGAFRKLIASGADIICQADHRGEPLGRISNGTLEVKEDSRGVLYACTLPDTQHARDTWTLVQRGDYPGCSFTFYVAENGDTWDRSATPPATLRPSVEWWGRRVIREFSEVRDMGPVTWPAYSETSVAATTQDSDASAGEGRSTGAADPASDDVTEQLQRRTRAALLARRTR